VLRQRYGARDLDSDPVKFVHRYGPADQEVVAWIASALAFGRVASIFASVDAVLDRLGPEPAACIREASRPALVKLLRGFRHRWVDGATLGSALGGLGKMLRGHGTLEAAFVAGDVEGEETLRGAIEGFSSLALRAAGPPHRALAFLLPSPSSGSACKRTCLFLRWLVRPRDGVDLGLWSGIDASRLVVPLDTHIAFMGRALTLTARRTAGWGMAEDITKALRSLDAEDPVKYDWALSRLGILGHCPERRDPVRCPPCPVSAHCRVGRQRSARSCP
jgi:uncharacterized protein (TIGR02757 family)